MMRKIAPLAALVILAACSRSSGKVQRGQQNYEVVQEGSASGVTSTINAPGETPAPMNNTAIDTTGNLTLQNPNPMGNGAAAPGGVAGALPSDPIYTAIPGSGMQGSPAPARPRVRVAPRNNAPIVTDTIGSRTPAMPREGRTPPPSGDTTSTRPPETDRTTPTATTDTTSTSTPPATDTRNRNDRSRDQPQQPPPPPTDTTSTRGQQLL